MTGPFDFLTTSNSGDIEVESTLGAAASFAAWSARASRVQVVPVIADEVESLTVYQRTPNWCTPLNNRPITPEEQAELRAGFERLREVLNTSVHGFHHPAHDRPGKPRQRELQPQREGALPDSARRRYCYYLPYRWHLDPEAVPHEIEVASRLAPTWLTIMDSRLGRHADLLFLAVR